MQAYKLFLSHIPVSIHLEAIQAYFSSFGGEVIVELQKNKGKRSKKSAILTMWDYQVYSKIKQKKKHFLLGFTINVREFLTSNQRDTLNVELLKRRMRAKIKPQMFNHAEVLQLFEGIARIDGIHLKQEGEDHTKAIITFATQIDKQIMKSFPKKLERMGYLIELRDYRIADGNWPQIRQQPRSLIQDHQPNYYQQHHGNEAYPPQSLPIRNNNVHLQPFGESIGARLRLMEPPSIYYKSTMVIRQLFHPEDPDYIRINLRKSKGRPPCYRSNY